MRLAVCTVHSNTFSFIYISPDDNKCYLPTQTFEQTQALCRQPSTLTSWVRGGHNQLKHSDECGVNNKFYYVLKYSTLLDECIDFSAANGPLNNDAWLYIQKAVALWCDCLSSISFWFSSLFSARILISMQIRLASSPWHVPSMMSSAHCTEILQIDRQ